MVSTSEAPWQVLTTTILLDLVEDTTQGGQIVSNKGSMDFQALFSWQSKKSAAQQLRTF